MITGSDEVGRAIRHALVHVRRFIEIYTVDVPHQPDNAEIAERRNKVESICAEIEKFAERANTHFSEFAILRKKLDGIGANILDEDLMAITRAFRKAGRL